ncbi:MAG: 2-oxo acid dehydrogenase subunit E2 [Chloroflexota bacterium]
MAAWRSKPGVVKGTVQPREFLNLTLTFDHDVVDGAPATRFTQDLVRRLEGAEALDRDM